MHKCFIRIYIQNTYIGLHVYILSDLKNKFGKKGINLYLYLKPDVYLGMF